LANILGSYDLPSPEDGGIRRVSVAEGVDAAHLDYIEQAWRPVIKKQRDRAVLEYFQLPEPMQTIEAYRAILERLGIPDEHWVWREKAAIAPALRRALYSLLSGPHVEAIMMLLFGRTSRLAPEGEELIYVDYLAVAPWNRRAIQNPERLRGTGSLLMGAAVEVSRMNNMGGRCALHSIPSAEGFYRRIGMQEFGADPSYHDFVYFEFDANGARTFTS
jgi:hypothetical protein